MTERNLFDDVLEEYVNPILTRGQVSMSNNIDADSIRNILVDMLDNRYVKNTNNNLLLSIDKRFNYLKVVYAGDMKLLDDLYKLEKDIYQMVLLTIEEYYDFKLNLEDGDRLFDNLRPLVKDIYSFFVEDFSENLLVAFHSYVITNEEVNAAKFSVPSKTKDLGLNSMKGKFQKDIIGMTTVHHLSDIIEFAVSEFKNDDTIMLDYICNYEEDELTFMKIRELFIYNEEDENNTGIPVGVLGPDFIHNFISPITNIDGKMKLKSALDNILTEEYINLNS